jgi:ATP-dependent DNA helicase RecQ
MTPVWDALGINNSVLGGLPPDVRDRLLEYVSTWETPADTLALVELLREAHGPLLFLLDVQAEALLANGEARAALDVVERRQRRSSTLASQVLEARALLAMGRSETAASLAAGLADGSPKSQTARVGAAELLAATGAPAHAEQAIALLHDWLAHHPGDVQATLALAQTALGAGKNDLAADMSDRFGSGIPADLSDRCLPALAALFEALGRQESAQAARSEQERRRFVAWERVRTAIAPYTSLDAGEGGDAEALFRRLNGPESAPATRDEARRVRLEAVRHFGFGALREGQTEAIASVLRGESLLLVMPTGAGKSLCYQLPGLVLPRASLVISPLIALMKDQVESLPLAARKSATFINSTLTDEELAERMAGVARGRYKLIYAAPERLRQRAFLRALRQSGLDLFVIDEAHCVSLWGHDFRPDYLFLQEARHELGSPTTLAMTATAPPRVRDEILDYMRVDGAVDEGARGDGTGREQPAGAQARVITLDIFRSNLHLSALKLENEEQKLEAVKQFVRETPGAGIVYVNSRHKSETLAWALRDAGVTAEAYHAGLQSRGEVQDRFMAGATRVVVATVAFGMGIDKADIRFIVHFHPSRSLAGYYQEVGRAGRDGMLSQGVLLYSNNDWANLRRWAQSDEYDMPFLEKVYAAVAAQLAPATEPSGDSGPMEGAVGDAGGDGGPRLELVREAVSGAVDAYRLQQVLNTDETAVRVAVSLLERADILTRGFDVAQEAAVQLPATLPASARTDGPFRDFVRTVALRPGKQLALKLAPVATALAWSHADLEGRLMDWQAAGWLMVKFSRRALFIDLPPTPPDMRMRLDRLIGQSQALGQRRIDDMVGYATTDGCRHGYISAHFGSPPRARCTVCDVCTGIRPNLPTFEQVDHLLPDDTDIAPMIIDCLISLPRPMGRSGLAKILIGHLRASFTPDKARHHGALKGLGEGGVLEYIDDLLESGRLRQYERQGFLVLAPTLAGRSEAEAWREQHPELGAYGEAPPPADAAEDGDAPAEVADPGETYTGLQKALWLWRRRLAEELKQPPYVVMSNDLMLQIAERRPHSLDELGALPGMGAQRLAHYGPTVLDLVRLHPPAEGDGALLGAQRTALAEAKANGQAKVSYAREQAVSPRTQKQIFMKLQEIRQKVAVGGRGRVSEVAGNNLLQEIAAAAPATLEALEAVPGFRSSGLRDQGPQIVTYIAALRSKESAGQ